MAYLIDNPSTDPGAYVEGSPLWVFGYGSLIWKPGFDYVSKSPATIHGYHRSLCLYSYVHRGTPENPGLVLALDRGGSTKGLAFEVAPENAMEVITYLRARELVTAAYIETWVPMHIEGRSETVKSISFVIDRSHEQYAGNLSDEDCASQVKSAVGKSGDNPEYLYNTINALSSMKIRDRKLERIADLTREL